MRRAAVIAVVVLGMVGVAGAGDKKLPGAVSLVERQPQDVEPHASLEARETPEPLSLVERQPQVVVPHAFLEARETPEPLSLVGRQPQDVEPHPAILLQEER